MGAATNLVQNTDTTPSALKLVGELIDTLDKAIDVKQQDLAKEPLLFSENSWKLGILASAQDLVRRARAILEDYASPPEALKRLKAPEAPKASEALEPPVPWLVEGIQLEDNAHVWDVTIVARNDEGEVISVTLETEHNGRTLTLAWDESNIENFFGTYAECHVVEN